MKISGMVNIKEVMKDLEIVEGIEIIPYEYSEIMDESLVSDNEDSKKDFKEKTLKIIESLGHDIFKDESLVLFGEILPDDLVFSNVNGYNDDGKVVVAVLFKNEILFKTILD